MSGLFNILEIGKSNLMAQQTALGVLNHNIANSNTPGFSRQRTILSSRPRLGSIFNNMGNGVNVLGIQRITDTFQVSRLGHARSEFGARNAVAKSFDALESAFGEPADPNMGEKSLSGYINDFLNSWSPVINPEIESTDTDMRAFIIESARTLSSRFNSMADDMKNQADSLRSSIEDTVSEVNRLLHVIADVNLQIESGTVSDASKNDLEDMRQHTLLQLTELSGAEWDISEDGGTVVYMQGRAVVNNGSVHGIEVSNTGNAEDRVRGMAVSPINSSQSIAFGSSRLQGQLKMLNEDLPSFLGRMDRLAMHIMEEVNAIHQTADGSQGGGVDLFVGTDASNMAINDVIDNNPELLSLMGTMPDGQEIAAAIFDLHTKNIDAENGMTIEGFYSTIIGDLGARSKSAYQLEESSLRLLEGVEQKLESVSGVNVDEEMANMLVVQSSYQAASKIISIVDELIQTVISMV